MKTMLAPLLMLAAGLLPALAGAQTPLENGFIQIASNPNQGTTQTFVLSVPANMSSVSFETTGGTGNVSMAVDLGNDGSTECTSAGPTNEEYCELANPAAGDYYLKLTATTAYANLGLVGVSAIALQDGVSRTIFGLENSRNWFYLDVPPDQSRLEVETRGGTGDPDLYVKDDLFDVVDCESESDGTAEDCRIGAPAPTRWYVIVEGFTDYTGVVLEANYLESSDGGVLPLSALALFVLGYGLRRRRRA